MISLTILLLQKEENIISLPPYNIQGEKILFNSRYKNVDFLEPNERFTLYIVIFIITLNILNPFSPGTKTK
jgi:hypothetical protein